jgi:hypothetical protein
MATNTQIPVADRRVPVIAPGHTFSTITEKISNIVLSRPVSLGWIVGFLIVFGMMNMLMMAWVPVHQRYRDLGHQHPHRLGIRHRQLCVVDRHWPRGHADLCDSLSAPPDLA